MIGSYRYWEAPPSDAVIVRLSRRDDQAYGAVHLPSDLRAVVADLNIMLLKEGEAVTLPLALGYGVIVAGLSGRPLYLSGDVEAWPERWGPLDRIC